jgi:hypothetical protein
MRLRPSWPPARDGPIAPSRGPSAGHLPANRMWMKSKSDPLRSSPGGSACPRPQGKATEGRMFASVAPREVVARLRRGVAKPQVKLLIGVSDPYWRPIRTARHDPRTTRADRPSVRGPARDQVNHRQPPGRHAHLTAPRVGDIQMCTSAPRRSSRTVVLVRRGDCRNGPTQGPVPGTSPSQDQCGMGRPSGTSSAERW